MNRFTALPPIWVNVYNRDGTNEYYFEYCPGVLRQLDFGDDDDHGLEPAEVVLWATAGDNGDLWPARVAANYVGTFGPGERPDVDEFRANHAV